MAHAGFEQYAKPVTAALIHTGEIELRSGLGYIRMEPEEAAKLAQQLTAAIELATAAAVPADAPVEA